MKKIFLFISITSMLFCACSEIPTEIPPPPDTPANGRVMLIEEYTGVKCGPCATGALLLEEILENGNGAIVAYAVHGSFLSDPHSNSKYDFRYPDSKEMETAATQLFAKPSITYNRVSENGQTLVKEKSDTWQPLIDVELEKKQVAALDVDVQYDENTRIAEIFIRAEALETISGTVNINVVVSESHLVDPQQDGSDVIDAFDHKHVVKKSLSKLSGDFLIDNFQAGASENKPYTYTIPEEVNGEWIPENMEITVYISSTDLGGEVLQAAQVYVTE